MTTWATPWHIDLDTAHAVDVCARFARRHGHRAAWRVVIAMHRWLDRKGFPEDQRHDIIRAAILRRA